MKPDTKYHRIEHHDGIEQCPYCGNIRFIDPVDYSFLEKVVTCVKCGCNYETAQEQRITTYSKPNCELNGKEHEWSFPFDVSREWVFKICTVCGCTEFPDPIETKSKEDSMTTE